MTLLTLCQNAARQVGLPAPATIVGNGDQAAVDLLALARREGTLLARGHDWAVLTSEHTFATAAGSASYDLPADFRSLATATVWNRGTHRPVRGPLTPAAWQARVSGPTASPRTATRFRIRAEAGVRRFVLEPTPVAAETLAFDYVSTHWCRSAGGAGQETWLADDDVALIEEGLIELGLVWRTLSRLGLPYGEERADYEAELMRARARDGGMAVVSLDRGGRRRDDAGSIAGTPPSWGGTPGLIWGYSD